MQILASASETDCNVLPPMPRWQWAMKQAVRDVGELCQLLGLPTELACTSAARDFPVFAPRGYVARMRPGDPRDPLLRQVLPVAEETVATPGFSADPVGDLAAEAAPGLLHKYHGRVLMITTGACAVHCRYCFRRHFPYTQAPHSIAGWQPAIEQIAADATVEEVILSGGDPLTLADETLAALAGRLAEIPHLRRLRVHTRLPIMIPERVNEALLDWLCGSRLTPVVVVHANHANELDDAVGRSLAQLAQTGVLLLNQTVLLRGINDSVQALAELSQRLIELRVTPYYLHQLDRVRGAAHFEVPIDRGVELIEQLRARLPGYLVPRYVVERPGGTAKEAVGH
jgi:EF-P beta-lysylation protein EpmB